MFGWMPGVQSGSLHSAPAAAVEASAAAGGAAVTMPTVIEAASTATSGSHGAILTQAGTKFSLLEREMPGAT